jgi:hypothetical protein
VNVGSTPPWAICVALIAYLIALAGQLALMTLVIGPSITVGGAIAHGTRRLPVYIAAVLILVLALLVLLLGIGLVLAALGVHVERQVTPQMSPVSAVAGLLFLAIFMFLFVRMVMSAPIASAETVGPIAILQRSWRLTQGHWWALFGFLLIFFIGAGIVVLAIGSAAGVVLGFTLGKIQPMSAAALVLALIDALVSAAVTTLLAVMLARIYLQLAGRGEVRASVPSSGI